MITNRFLAFCQKLYDGLGSTPQSADTSTHATSTPAFGSTASPTFGPSASGTQNSPFGAQAKTPTFGSIGLGQPTFGGQQGGDRVAPYTPTYGADNACASGTQPAGKLESIWPMIVDKDGPLPAGQSAVGIDFGGSTLKSNLLAPTGTFGQSSTFGSSGFGASSTPAFTSPPFHASSSANPLASTSSTEPFIFGATSTAAFGTVSSPSLFNMSSSSGFGSSPSIFGSAHAQGTTPSIGSSFANTQSSGLFSTAPSIGHTGSAFGQSTTPSFAQSSLFNTPSTDFGGNIFSSTPSLISSANPGFSQIVVDKDKSPEELRWEKYHKDKSPEELRWEKYHKVKSPEGLRWTDISPEELRWTEELRRNKGAKSGDGHAIGRLFCCAH